MAVPLSTATPAPEGQPVFHFDGATYDPFHDQERLTTQTERVYAAMRSGEWLTVDEIARATGDPQASISAQLRHLRKPRFGSYTVERRARGDRGRGLYEYRVVPK